MIREQATIRGTIMRLIIKFVMDTPLMRKTGFLENAARISHMKPHWKAPKGFTLKRHDLNGIPIEMLINEKGEQDKVILHFHGGAYIMRYFDYYRIIAHKYAKISNANVCSLDYRTAPNHTFPDALNDALKVWNWLIESGYQEKNIIIAGDSAGGNLALALTMTLRDQGHKLPKGLVLMSPWTDLDQKGDSYNYNVHKDPIFGKHWWKKEPKAEQMHHLIRSYAGNTDYKNKYLSPAYGEFNDFPPMLIQVGSYEVLESDSIIIYKKAKEAQVEVKFSSYYGMFHDFQMLLNILPESKDAWNEVEQFIQYHFN